MTGVRIRPSRGGLRGVVGVPGDKSIAHRAILLGALADGTTTVSGFPGGADTWSSIGAARALGARVAVDGTTIRIDGAGLALGPAAPATIDCGNSGTTMRLAAGLAAGGPGEVVLDGDASLRRRPMARVVEPLRRMGADIDAPDGRAPLRIRGGALAGIDWTSPVASAQVKSAVLLAGLRARGTTRVREPLRSRDHTERMLPAFGIAVARDGHTVGVTGGRPLLATTIPLPGDASSAAFFVVAALLVAGSALRLAEVGTNPTRTGFLAVLARMGGRVAVDGARDAGGEPRADLLVQAARLGATSIAAAEVPRMIDEIPALCIAAALADGDTVVAGAEELRVKESDRIAALEQLALLGVDVRTACDGLTIRGTAGRPLRGARIRTGGDHRIAMAFAVAGLLAPDGVEIDDPACADVSFPGFFDRLRDLGAVVEAA